MKNKKQLIEDGVSILNKLKSIQVLGEVEIRLSHEHNTLVQMYREWYSSVKDWLNKNKEVEVARVLLIYDSDLLQMPYLFSRGFSFYQGDDAEKVYSDFLKKWEIAISEKIEKLNELDIIPPTEKVEIYLDDVGDLWRMPKDKYCYEMGQESDRCKIIRYLIENKGYQQTSAISVALEGKDKRSIRTEIGKIRNHIENSLKLKKGLKAIEGKKGSGYKLNSKLIFKIKK